MEYKIKYSDGGEFKYEIPDGFELEFILQILGKLGFNIELKELVISEREDISKMIEEIDEEDEK